VHAPGWDAIDAVLIELYGPLKPRHVGYVPGVHLGSGLQGCSAYPLDGHWHYVTYGLTELYEKDPDGDPAISGWGYELTMRVSGPSTEAPAWPFNLLEAIARDTRTRGVAYMPGDRLHPGGPITGAAGSRLVSMAFAPDAVLPSTSSVNGAFSFHQVVGITAEEADEMKSSSTQVVLDRMRSTNPLLITDASR
jgi:hypothetical protein